MTVVCASQRLSGLSGHGLSQTDDTNVSSTSHVLNTTLNTQHYPTLNTYSTTKVRLSVTHTLTQASLCEHASWPLTGDGTLELASKAAPCTCTAAQIEHRSEHSHGKRSVGTNQGGGSAYPFRV
jgi:hypothetical protein